MPVPGSNLTTSGRQMPPLRPTRSGPVAGQRLKRSGLTESGAAYGDAASAVEACRLLLDAYPEAATLARGRGYSIEPRTHADLRPRAPGYQSSTCKATHAFRAMWAGGRPLHLACEYRAPPPLLLELLRAHPAAAADEPLPILEAC